MNGKKGMLVLDRFPKLLFLQFPHQPFVLAVCTSLYRPANLDQPEGMSFISGNDKKVPQSAV